MYIAPDTTIRILKNVPLDATYEHTIYWSTLTSQRDYFIGKTKYIFQNQSYQRVNKGRLRIERKAEDLYDCNYLMFQNSAFGNKWFYAFITGVNYVNNITSEIEYELDVMCTWFFDYELKQCFVEREHSLTDNVGDNLMPEPVALGDYVYSEQSQSGIFTDWVIVLATYSRIDGGVVTNLPARGTKIRNNVQLLEYKVFELNDLNGLVNSYNNLWTLIVGGGNYIANVFLCPRSIANVLTMQTDTLESNAPFNITSYGHSGDRWYYKPRNNKLLTYPYNYLEVNNMQGSVNEFRFERFGNSSPKFTVVPDMSANPSVIFIAENYMNNANVANSDCIITVPSLPIVTHVQTDFGAKMVQLGQFIASLAIGAGGVGAGVASEEASANLNNAVSKLNKRATEQNMRRYEVARDEYARSKRENLEALKEEESNQSDYASVAKAIMSASAPHSSHTGQYGTPNALQSIGMFDVIYKIKHITPEYARVIDDFFDRYGYATRRNKVPNRNARPHWNYVKTATCTIDGSIPSDDERKICNIYNRGITFWIHGSEVGDYSLDNSPT